MSFPRWMIALALGVGVIQGCKDDDVPSTSDITQDSTPYVLDYGNFVAPEIASDNPLTVQGVKLGRMLFYEKMLSGDGSQACASCHLQEFAFSDTATFSIGIRKKPGKRQAMGVFNMAWNSNEFFWDGRAHLLRDQSLKPIQDELEMDETLENVVAKLSASETYRNQFKRTFGSEEITPEKMSLAMEQFMNSIVSNRSKYDQFLADSTVFTESEKRGYVLFNTEYNKFFPDESGADCAHCHGGDNFENDEYMNNGLDGDGQFADDGREKVTMNMADKGKFKVPSLRNIAVTAPYMHDGRFKSLEEVVDHYNTGLVASSALDQALEQTRETGLMLSTQQKADLVAFLKTLTDESLLTDPRYASPF
ncbi:MAG: c-type cytochrome [Flavobacteriales bacterium]|nr:c-type cytochrome [Bacteroidota bacterium]MCB9241199.1 c-type cytochrome [Flavobacteriales bacterium]